MIVFAFFNLSNTFKLLLLPTLVFLSISPAHGECGLFSENGAFAPDTPPVIVGKVFQVPDMKFRFQLDKESANEPGRIDIFYMWQWLGQPSPGETRGMWNEAGDIFECKRDTDGNLSVPAYKVVPKGWYSGQSATERVSNIPFFDHIEISFVTKDCGTPRIILKKQDISKFQRMIAVVSIPCGGLAKVKFVK